MIDIVLEMHWSNNPIPLDQLKSDPDCILDIPLGLFTSLESPVKSVNGITGDVILNADDVGADPVGAAQVVLETLDNQKLDKIDYVQHFRGLFSSYAALTAALPIALDGDYAHIDSGSGFDRMSAIWDSDDSKWTVNAVNVGSNTDEVPEGSTNLYFKSERVRQTPLTGLNTNDDSPVTQSDSIETAVGKLQAQNNNSGAVVWVDISTLTGTTFWNGLDLTKTKIELAKINGMIWIRGVFTIGNSGSMSINIEIFRVVDVDWMFTKLTNTIENGARGFFQFMTASGSTLGSAAVIRADGYPFLGMYAQNRASISYGNTLTIFPSVIGIANS